MRPIRKCGRKTGVEFWPVKTIGILCFAIAFFCLLFGGILPNKALASVSGLELEVMPKLPENQIIAEANYFDLLLKPGEKQTASLFINNPTSRPRTLTLEINPATTNSHGKIEYEPKAPAEDLVPFDIRKAVKAPETIELAPEELKEIPLEIKMPDITYDGIVAGGIKISEVTTEESTAATEPSSNETSESNGLAIRNEYSYVVALLLSQNQKEVAPDIEFFKADLSTELSKDAIDLSFKNVTNAYLNDAYIQATIAHQDGLLTISQDDGGRQIAPATIFSFPVLIEEKIPMGEYQVAVDIYGYQDDQGSFTNGKGEKYRFKWELQDTFTMENRVIKGNSGTETYNSNGWKYIGLLLFSGLTGGFIYLGKRLKKKRVKVSKLRH